jgi:hypothetical protein
MQTKLFIDAFKHLIIVSLSTLLIACGGGGSGGGSSSSSSFNTTEFQANYALAQIGALTAYNGSGTGSGVTVAVLDTGIDQTHTDLSANISGSSSAVGSISTGLQDTDGHGTNVAGIIGAVRNDTGTHGVAFSSTILAVKIGESSASFADMAAGIDYAVANGAKVINISFTSTSVSSTVVTALQSAVDAGVMIVQASGNSGSSESSQHARLSNCSSTVDCSGFGVTFDAKSLMLAVGSVGTSNAISSFTNLAGDTASAYLVAPGESIVTTALNGGTTSVSGTSFSAPHVAGAAALLLQRFPSLTTTQVVALLLSSATDLGSSGTDTTFGVGLLNLAAAFSAQGASVVPLTSSVKGSSSSLDTSKIALGTAFGNALSQYSFMQRAIILDAYERAYQVDLRNRIESSSSDLTVLPFLSNDGFQNISMPMPKGLSLNINVNSMESMSRNERQSAFMSEDDSPVSPSDRIGSLRFSAELDKNTNVNVGHRASTMMMFGDTISQQANDGLFFNSGWTASPQLALLGQGNSLMMAQNLSPETKLDFGIHNSNGFSTSSVSGAGQLAQAQLSHKTKSGLGLGMSTGVVSENETLFSSSSTGAFGTTARNNSLFVSLSSSWKLSDKTNLFGTFTEISAKPAFSGDSLFSNWERVYANSFSVGVSTRSSFVENDRLGLAVGQPLRVHRSGADLTIPVGRDVDGNILQESHHVDLSPTGRQTDIRLAYNRKIGDYSTLSSFATLSLQPGHDKDANPETAVGVKWGLKF